MPETLSDRVLRAAVEALGGVERPGQHQMAEAIDTCFTTGEHLLVQAGTGTGKSLGYLVPALVRLTQHPDQRVVVATATLALQAQLAHKDIPVALDAVEKVTGRRPRASVLKGRTNYACLLKVRDVVGDDGDQDTLLGGEDLVETLKASSADADSVLGAEVLALREWAEGQLKDKQLADRDDAPSHSPKAWQQVSIPVRECLGAQRCPYGHECFVERSREIARGSDLVVTNHALLAIDAMHGNTALPEHDLLVIDEAHELVSRVTGAASMELSPQMVVRVARRAMTWLDDDTALDLLDQAELFDATLDETPLERVTDPDSAFAMTMAALRDVARKAVSELGKDTSDAERHQAQAAMKEIFDVAERMAALDEADVVWVVDRDRFGREARVAPLSVAGLMRTKVLAEKTAVLTSATLKIGGDFAAAADSVGLHRNDVELPWRGLDVGSPFAYPKQGILYVATHLDPPRREGIQPDALTEIAELVWAAKGRTLGLFASQRAAEAAAVYVRRELPKQTVLCQGDAHLAELMKRFVNEPETTLFGTVSLWQGIDVPGETCELVIIDKIPFPRPDEPLMQARQKDVEAHGGNGFMQVAARHAALLLAQGSGRLIRRASDRGVVAVLDPRLLTARYGGYLRASMPPFWTTTDREVAVGALQRLQQARETPTGAMTTSRRAQQKR